MPHVECTGLALVINTYISLVLDAFWKGATKSNNHIFLLYGLPGLIMLSYSERLLNFLFRAAGSSYFKYIIEKDCVFRLRSAPPLNVDARRYRKYNLR